MPNSLFALPSVGLCLNSRFILYFCLELTDFAPFASPSFHRSRQPPSLPTSGFTVALHGARTFRLIATGFQDKFATYTLVA